MPIAFDLIMIAAAAYAIFNLGVAYGLYRSTQVFKKEQNSINA